jgi:hypothetical protein
MTGAKHSSYYSEYRFSVKRFILGIVTFAGFLYISSFAHEFGHIAVCQASGFNSILYLNQYTFDTRASGCSGLPQNYLLFWSAGGLSGMAVSLVPLVLLHNRYKFLIVGCAPIAVANAIAALLETFAHEWYTNETQVSSLLTTVPMLGVGVYMLLRYSLMKTRDDASSVIS